VFHISGSKFIAARQIIFNGNCCVRVAKNLRHPLSHWELLLSAPSTFHNGLTSVTACLYFGEDQGAKDVAGENYIKAGIYSRQQQHNVATCNTPTHPHTPTHTSTFCAQKHPYQRAEYLCVWGGMYLMRVTLPRCAMLRIKSREMLRFVWQLPADF